METLQERKKLNEIIEQAYISAAIYVRNIKIFQQTERGTTLIALYEGLYSEFQLLVLLTSDLQQMEKSQDDVNNAEKWLSSKMSVSSMNDRDLLARCNEGVTAFMKYKKVLSKQGVIALPSR